MVRYEECVKGQLALTAWRWGKDYGGHQASLMIAHCLHNRHLKGWNTWFGIIDSIPRYSGTLEIPTGWPDQWDRNFVKILAEMDGIYDSVSKDLVNGGLHWADTTRIDSPHFLESVSRNPEHHMVANMGSLTFWD